MTVAGQLVDELGTVGARLTAVLGVDVAEMLEERIAASADVLAGQLASGDDRLVAQTVIDVMAVLWPHGSPEDVGEPDWWRTPLGRVCARSLGREDVGAVTRTVAAAMLGVTPGTVAQLVARGTLGRHPDGGVLRASVLQRLSR